jgi:TP901 family phage tail tape measure protein
MPASTGAIRAGRAFVEIFADDSKLSRDLRRASGKLSRFGADVRNIGAAMVGVSTAAAAPVIAATRVYAEFSDQMNAVRAVTGATSDEFEKLNRQAKELGRTTSFKAGDAAGGQAELGRAGFKPDEILNATPAVLALARATGTDLPEAAGIAAAALRQFGLDTSETGRVADRLTFTANNSFNTLTSLGEALKFAGPVAADLNMSLEDTLAILGTLGNLGIQGTMAGNTIKRLSVIGAAAAEKLESIFGRSFRDAAGNALPIVDVLEAINDATKDQGSAERTKKLNQAFGLLGITGASAVGKAAGSVRELQKDMEAANGVAEKTATTMDAGLGGSLRKLASAIEGSMIAVGESLAGTFGDLASRITEATGTVTEWIEQNRETVVGIVKGIAVVGGLGLGLVALGTSFQIAAFAMSGFTTAANLAAGGIAILAGQTQLTGAALLAAKAGMLAAAAAAGYGLGTAIVHLTGVYQNLNEQLTESTRLFGELAKVRDKRKTAEIEAALKIAKPGGAGVLAELETAAVGADKGSQVKQAATESRKIVAEVPDISAAELMARLEKTQPGLSELPEVKAAVKTGTQGDTLAAFDALRKMLKREQRTAEQLADREKQQAADLPNVRERERQRIESMGPFIVATDRALDKSTIVQLAEDELAETRKQASAQAATLAAIEAALQQVEGIASQDKLKGDLDAMRAATADAMKAATQVDIKPLQTAVAGTFSGSLLDRMSAQGPLKAIDETAKNTKDIANGIGELNDNVLDLQQNWGA